MSEPTEKEVAAFNDMFEPQELHPDLAGCIGPGPFGEGLYHPLVHEPFYKDVMNKRYNMMYLHKTEALKKAIAADNWHSYIFLHERPYRVDALDEVLNTHQINDPEVVWPLIASAWIDSENIYQNLQQWMDIWDLDIPKRSEHIHDENDLKALANLPEVIPIYRGIAHKDAVEGMSWTTDKDKAIWFAQRFSGGKDRVPYLVTAKVKKSNVIAHFLGRNESEIVAFPWEVEIERTRKCLKRN